MLLTQLKPNKPHKPNIDTPHENSSTVNPNPNLLGFLTGFLTELNTLQLKNPKNLIIGHINSLKNKFKLLKSITKWKTIRINSFCWDSNIITKQTTQINWSTYIQFICFVWLVMILWSQQNEFISIVFHFIFFQTAIWFKFFKIHYQPYFWYIILVLVTKVNEAWNGNQINNTHQICKSCT